MKRLFYIFPLMGITLGIYMLSINNNKVEVVKKNELVRPVKVSVVQKSVPLVMRSYPGKTQAKRKVKLAFRVPGPLVQFPVNKGDIVKKDAIIARIDPRDYQIRFDAIKSALGEAKAQLKAMQAGSRQEDIKILEANLAAARAQLKQARSLLKRFNLLKKDNAISQADYDTHYARYEVAKSKVQTVTQQLKKARVGARTETIEAMKEKIKGLQAQERQTLAQLNDTYLRAPFSGYIADKYVDNFQNVQAKQPIVCLQDISHIEVVINISEKAIIRTQREDLKKFTVIFPLLPEHEFSAKLKEYNTEADAQTQTYSVTFTLPRPSENILPGMTAKVNIYKKIRNHKKGYLQVPSGAVFSEKEGKQYVWIVEKKDMTVHKVKVVTGGFNKNSILIRNSIKAGDTVVTAGVHYLRDGMKIKLAKDYTKERSNIEFK